MGQDYDALGPKTLREVSLILDGCVTRLQHQAKQDRMGRYELAQLIGVMFHSPKDFPSAADFLEDVPAKKPAMSVADLRSFFKEHGEARSASVSEG